MIWLGILIYLILGLLFALWVRAQVTELLVFIHLMNIIAWPLIIIAAILGMKL